MIQRIQTIYLLLSGIISGGLTFVFHLWSTIKGKQFIIDFFSKGSALEKMIPVLFFSSAVLSIVVIFLFKNRKLQFVLGRINILINLLLLGVLIYLSQTLSGGALVSEKGIGMIFPVIVILLLVLANKAIKRDENLVKSVDRLR